MKKILYILTFCAPLWMFSCVDNNDIGAPQPINPSEYVLPQGGASQWAENWIQNTFETYGSYFLYKMTQKDFEWTQTTGTSTPSRIDSVVLMNPAHVEYFIKFLEEVWLNNISEGMKHTWRLPYRVLLVDMMRQNNPAAMNPDHEGYPYQYNNEFLVKGTAIVISYTTVTTVNNADWSRMWYEFTPIHEMTAAQKTAKKERLANFIFNTFYAIPFPEAWFDLSDYDTPPPVEWNAQGTLITAGVTGGDDNPAMPNYDPNDVNYERKVAWRHRGFLPSGYNAANNNQPNEWLSNAYAWNTARITNDQSSFMTHLMTRTDAQMQFYLDTYPLIKEKWDFLVNYFTNEFGIDVRGIANMVYTD